MPGVEDITFEAHQLIFLLSKLPAKKLGQYGFEIIQPLLTAKNTGVGWFEYDDPLSIVSAPGPEAAKFDLGFLGGPLVITEQEEIENAEEHRRVNLLRFKFDQLMLSVAEEINQTGFKGNGVNTKAIPGLEDMVHADNHSAGTVDSVTRAQATASNNTYGGIARTGTTGWENLAVDLTAAADNDFLNAGFTGLPYLALEHIYALASRGALRPDIILSSLQPYVDIHKLMAANVTYERSVDTFKGINLGHDNLKFRSAVWFYDEEANMHADSGSQAATSSEIIYVLNSRFLALPVETGYDFGLTNFQTPVDSRISVAHVLWRGTFLSTNPRHLAVLHGYNET